MKAAVLTKPVKYLYWLFVSCSIISFLYAVINKRYNGDFLGVEVTLSPMILFFNLLFCIFPFFITWKIYLYFQKKEIKRKISIPTNFFFYFLIIVMFWNAIVTVIYGVGIMGAPAYYAPPLIKPVIQVMNRFNYMYGVFIFILLVPKKDKKQIVLVLMLLVLAYMRAGLGVFMYLGMIYYVKYFSEIKYFFKRRLLLFMPIIIFFPLLVTLLYTVRANLRKQDTSQITTDPITGILIGRLSSFSDSAFIIQQAPYFFLNAQQLDYFYFQKQAMSVFSQKFLPAIRPEIMLFKFYYEDSEDNVAYMAGTQGNLYISLMRSNFTFFLNLLTIVIYIYLTFYIFRLLRFDFANELGFILLLYVLMSGVSDEYAFIIFSITVFVLLFLTVNYIKNKIFIKISSLNVQ